MAMSLSPFPAFLSHIRACLSSLVHAALNLLASGGDLVDLVASHRELPTSESHQQVPAGQLSLWWPSRRCLGPVHGAIPASDRHG